MLPQNRIKHLNEKDGMRMELNQENNQVRLCGTMAAAPRYSHSAGGQDFYSFPLEVERLSGSFDTLNIVLRESRLADVEAEEKARLLFWESLEVSTTAGARVQSWY